MAEKFNTRIIHKHDIEANWAKATGFIPKEAELIVYDPDENFSYARTKMGDGITKVNDLPFINVQADWNQNDENANDYIKNRPFHEGPGKELIFPANNTSGSGWIFLEDVTTTIESGVAVGEVGH
jgi:hypothetical protein